MGVEAWRPLRRGQRGRHVAYAVVATLLGLLLLEGLCRVVPWETGGPPGRPGIVIDDVDRQMAHDLTQPDPLLLWRLRPGAPTHTPGEKTSPMEFRGRDPDLERSERFRILALGDSVTFGFMVSPTQHG